MCRHFVKYEMVNFCMCNLSTDSFPCIGSSCRIHPLQMNAYFGLMFVVAAVSLGQVNTINHNLFNCVRNQTEVFGFENINQQNIGSVAGAVFTLFGSVVRLKARPHNERHTFDWHIIQFCRRIH